eukprot:102615-Rhodomonas_salina.2
MTLSGVHIRWWMRVPDKLWFGGWTQVYEGVQMIDTVFLKGLQEASIKKFVPQGEKFDPNLHNAMFELPAGRPLPRERSARRRSCARGWEEENAR